MDDDGRLIALGVFGAPHGVTGEVRLKSFTAEPRALLSYEGLRLADGAPLLLAGGRSLKDDLLVVRVAGITDRACAGRLTGQTLFCPRAALPNPADDEFYHADLIGLAAMSVSGVRLGTVVALHAFGAGDVVEIRDGAGETRLFTFSKRVVPVVDIPGGRIVIDPPEEIEAKIGDDGDVR